MGLGLTLAMKTTWRLLGGVSVSPRMWRGSFWSESRYFLPAALRDLGAGGENDKALPACLGHRIGKPPEFPPIGHEGGGGTIYQWTLRVNSYPHQIALMKGHQEMFDFLCSGSDMPTQYLVNCVLARREETQAIAGEHQEIVPHLPGIDRELVAKYCWETNTNYDAVKLMLDLGFPVANPEHSHGYTRCTMLRGRVHVIWWS